MSSLEQSSSISLLDRVNIIGTRENGRLIDAHVPLEMIYAEDVAVTESHVNRLGLSFQEERQKGAETGQVQPVLICDVPDFNQFPLADGFHRIAVLRRTTKASSAFATIRRGSSWQEVYDSRIEATSTHEDVKFARVIEWAKKSWGFTQWHDRVSMRQALALTISPTVTGARNGLTPEEVEAIRSLVKDKSEQWKIAPGTMYDFFLKGENAAPDLVAKTRTGRGEFTPAHLGEITRYYDDFAMQRIIEKVVSEQKLTVEQTKLLSVSLIGATTPEAALEIINSRLWKPQTSPPVARYTPPAAPVARTESPALSPAASSDTPRKDTGSPPVQPPPHTPRPAVSDHARIVERDDYGAVSTLQAAVFRAEMRNGELVIANGLLSGRIKADTINSPLADTQSPAPISIIDQGMPTQTQIILTHIENLKGNIRQQLMQKEKLSEYEAVDILSEVSLKTAIAIRNGNFQLRADSEIQDWTIRLTADIVNTRKADTPKKVEELAGKTSATALLDDVLSENEGGFREARRAHREAIKSKIGYITDEHRRFFVLRTFYDLSIDQIARVTGSSPSRTTEHLLRARQELARLIQRGQ